MIKPPTPEMAQLFAYTRFPVGTKRKKYHWDCSSILAFPGMNWELLSGIFGALDQFETEMDWSLSVGERANLAQTLYSELSSSDFRLWPQNRMDWERLFGKAFVATWGEDHECDPINAEELNLFFNWVFDSVPLASLDARLAYLSESELLLN